MDSVLQAHEQLEGRSNLARTITDVQATIALLQNARDAIAGDPDTALLAMARLKQPIKASFEKLDDDLKEVNKGLNQYQKVLDKKLKKNALPTASTEPLAEQPGLINRAIVMHLLREGKFDVANRLVAHINEKARSPADDGKPVDRSRPLDEFGDAIKSWMLELARPEALDDDADVDMNPSAGPRRARGWLQRKFTVMYHILDSLRNQHDLGPAIEWARQHSADLEQRGSNLEFELSRLKFVELYTSEDVMSDDPWEGPTRALEYAQDVFPTFCPRYTRETSSLLGSLAFSSALGASPYTDLFFNQSAWEEASDSFTREFCGLLGLSEKSPLYTAVTAGGIALPVLEKVERVMAQTRGQWTSVNELPVETPLPFSFKFHSVFVCPVSKEQATDENPPMMLTCGHVIAKESLEQHSRGKNRMKCPYCPVECAPRDAKRIFI